MVSVKRSRNVTLVYFPEVMWNRGHIVDSWCGKVARTSRANIVGQAPERTGFLKSRINEGRFRSGVTRITISLSMPRYARFLIYGTDGVAGPVTIQNAFSKSIPGTITSPYSAWVGHSFAKDTYRPFGVAGIHENNFVGRGMEITGRRFPSIGSMDWSDPLSDGDIY